MKAQVLSKFTEIWLPSLALMIFFSIFIFVIVYISRKKTKEYFNQVELIALDEGDLHE